MGPGRTHHADQRVLPAALPRTRRGDPPPAARALSLGRRGRGPTLRRDGEDHRRRGVLNRASAHARTFHVNASPALRSGAAKPTPASTSCRSTTAAPAKRWRGSARSTPASSARTSPGSARRASALKQLSCDRLLGICQQAAGLFLNETLPLGDQGHTQTPQQYVETLSATSGLPFVMVRRNMEKIAAGSRPNADRAERPHARPRPRHHRSRPGRTGGRADQLLSRRTLPRPGHAQQFARSELALAAGHSAQDAGDPEAGTRGALDALADHPGADRRRLSGGSVRLLSDRPRRRRRNTARLRPRPGLRRQQHHGAHTPTTPPSRCTAPASARSSSARTRSSAGRSSST